MKPISTLIQNGCREGQGFSQNLNPSYGQGGLLGHTGVDAKTWIAALDKHGLKAGAWSRKSLRLVTHRHIDDAAVEKVPGLIRAVSAELGGRDARVA